MAKKLSKIHVTTESGTEMWLRPSAEVQKEAMETSVEEDVSMRDAIGTLLVDCLEDGFECEWSDT